MQYRIMQCRSMPYRIMQHPFILYRLVQHRLVDSCHTDSSYSIDERNSCNILRPALHPHPAFIVIPSTPQVRLEPAAILLHRPVLTSTPGPASPFSSTAFSCPGSTPHPSTARARPLSAPFCPTIQSHQPSLLHGISHVATNPCGIIENQQNHLHLVGSRICTFTHHLSAQYTTAQDPLLTAQSFPLLILSNCASFSTFQQ